MSEDVKILDAGGKLMISGTARQQVEEALQSNLLRGAVPLGPVFQVGDKWVATCSIPLKGAEAAVDASQTLHFADIVQAAARPPTPGDLCRIEANGFKLMIYGPTRIHVQSRVDECIHLGASLQGEVEEVDGEWIAVCDTAGAQNTGFKW